MGRVVVMTWIVRYHLSEKGALNERRDNTKWRRRVNAAEGCISMQRDPDRAENGQRGIS